VTTPRALDLLLRTVVLVLAVIGLSRDAAAQGSGQLRVTVYDDTQAVIVHAIVTVMDHDGVEYQALVNATTGAAEFTGLVPGVYEVRVEAQGFQGYTVPVTIRRGQNRAVATLPVAFREDLVVRESVDSLRDHGFTRTLSREEIDALSDDPDEMAEQLRQMAGPGAQIFVDGFRGGRLPPKDQIQQIRFRTNSFSAEYHDAGMVGIDITTRPGMGGWRGAFNTGFRDRSFNARNAFAPTRGPEQQKRFMGSFQGPIVPGRTGLSVAVDGNLSHDSQTIVAETPLGSLNEQVRRPVDALNVSIRLEHGFSPTNSLRAEYARRDQSQRNLGAGDFDLVERAFDVDSVTDTLRVRSTRNIGRRAFNELRVELSRATRTQSSLSEATTIRVLDAFTSGGAGVSGITEGRQLTIAQNLDFTLGKHALRAGALIESGWWDSTQQSNANGTYTFSSLADFLAGRPRTYQRRVGDPHVSYSHVQAGWYIQDDFRLTRNVNVSLGLRQEVQTHVGDHWNVAPRGAFAWTAGKATVRGGYGIFYDWLEANIYEQTVRVDGTRQIDEIVIDPAFPAPDDRTGVRLPPSRIDLGPDLTQPTIHQASIGYERPLASWMGFRTDYLLTRATSTWRSINVNAPVEGLRPDPAVGNVTQLQSTGRRDSDRVTAALSMRAPSRSLMGNVMYQWSNTRNFADSPLALPSDSTNPDVDWGPSGMDARHRLTVMLNTPVLFGVRAGMQAQYSSALPYTITTGRDDNGDTVFNDRPAGVGRNSARGADHSNVNLRLTRSFSLGGMLGGDGPIRIGAPAPSASARGQMGGGGGMAVGTGMGGGPQARYRLDLYVQAFNVLNRTNYTTFVGTELSPYFGRPIAAAPPRRLELGVSLNF
jgi:hypothetical protein